MPRQPDFDKYAIVMQYITDNPEATHREICKECKCGPNLIPKAKKWKEDGGILPIIDPNRKWEKYCPPNDDTVIDSDTDSDNNNNINITKDEFISNEPLGKLEIMDILIGTGKESLIPEYQRISKILTLEDNNRNFQRRIIQDVIDMEIGLFSIIKRAVQ